MITCPTKRSGGPRCCKRCHAACFLRFAGGALVAAPISWAAEVVHPLLDHLILGCNNLDRGIAFIEEHTGVRAAFGGVHPGCGTRNALLSLGPHRYLEIIAPDLKQARVQQFKAITEMTVPRLIGWSAHPGDLETFAKKLRDAGVAFEGPRGGSRARPDGRILKWKTLNLTEDRGGILPFFIEWSTDSIHPSTDAPAGCRLEHFAVTSRDPAELSKTFQHIGIDAPIERGEKSHLRARITGPQGKFELSS